MHQLGTVSKMKYLAILPVIFVFVEAAKLDRGYLPPPPPNAKDAGGRDEDLQVPLEPPYIDPYSDNRHLLPGRRGPSYGYKPGKTTYRTRGDIEDEDQIRFFPDGLGKQKSRFLYGSYSYTGPNNILVTVTYTADGKKPTGRRNHQDDYDENQRRRFDGYDADGDDYDYDENNVIPTPPSLPREIQRAFAFHNRKTQQENRKDDRRGLSNRQPLPTNRQPLPPNRQPWNEQQSTQRPVIHQGYSYPKVTTPKY